MSSLLVLHPRLRADSLPSASLSSIRNHDTLIARMEPQRSTCHGPLSHPPPSAEPPRVPVSTNIPSLAVYTSCSPSHAGPAAQSRSARSPPSAPHCPPINPLACGQQAVAFACSARIAVSLRRLQITTTCCARILPSAALHLHPAGKLRLPRLIRINQLPARHPHTSVLPSAPLQPSPTAFGFAASALRPDGPRPRAHQHRMDRHRQPLPITMRHQPPLSSAQTEAPEPPPATPPATAEPACPPLHEISRSCESCFNSARAASTCTGSVRCFPSAANNSPSPTLRRHRPSAVPSPPGPPTARCPHRSPAHCRSASSVSQFAVIDRPLRRSPLLSRSTRIPRLPRPAAPSSPHAPAAPQSAISSAPAT